MHPLLPARVSSASFASWAKVPTTRGRRRDSFCLTCEQLAHLHSSARYSRFQPRATRGSSRATCGCVARQAAPKRSQRQRSYCAAKTRGKTAQCEGALSLILSSFQNTFRLRPGIGISLRKLSQLGIFIRSWEEYSYGVEAFRPESLYAPGFMRFVTCTPSEVIQPLMESWITIQTKLDGMTPPMKTQNAVKLTQQQMRSLSRTDSGINSQSSR